MCSMLQIRLKVVMATVLLPSLYFWRLALEKLYTLQESARQVPQNREAKPFPPTMSPQQPLLTKFDTV